MKKQLVLWTGKSGGQGVKHYIYSMIPDSVFLMELGDDFTYLINNSNATTLL